MNLPPPFSTVTAIDKAHFQEFRLASQTWRKWRPEMWVNPMLCFVDTAPPPDGESLGWWTRLLRRTTDHPNLKAIPWPAIPGATQRHRMLSAFIYGAAEKVKTDWMLKIDTDTLALKPPAGGWHHPNWWRENEPWEWISCAWGYTRGIDMWHRLKAWAATVPAFEGKPEVEGIENPLQNKISHARIISFVMHARMSFIREVAALHPGPLMPIESQDTFIFYVSKRLGKRYAAVRLKKFSWHHGARGMEKQVAAILREG